MAVTVERLGVVSLPHKAKILFTRKRSCIVIALITIFFCASNTRIFMTFGTIKILLNNMDLVDDAIHDNMTNLTTMAIGQEAEGESYIMICTPEKSKYLLPTTVWMFFNLTWYNLVPFLVILFCNICIIIIVTRATSARKHMATQGMCVMTSIKLLVTLRVLHIKNFSLNWLIK